MPEKQSIGAAIRPLDGLIGMDKDKDPGRSFHEVQRLPGWALVTVLSFGILMISLFSYGLVKQLVLGVPWGDKPLTNMMLAVVAPFFIAFGVLLLWTAAKSRLETKIMDGAIYIKYHPFHMSFRKIPLEDITDYEACTYNPMFSYGGWGIRYGRKGKAYNIRGNKGVRLTFTNGRTLLIGSDRPEEFVSAIDNLKGKQ